jgi:hypothetical protein
MLGTTPKEIINPLPVITGWADDSHYIKANPVRRGQGLTGSVSVGVVTDAETAYVPPAKDMSVSVRDKDIYLKKPMAPKCALPKRPTRSKTPPYRQITAK